MLIIIFILGICGLMFFILFKPMNIPERKIQVAYVQNNESSRINDKVSYSEAKQNV